MYKSYYESSLGIIEVTCDSDYLLNVVIVKKLVEHEENELSKLVVKQLDEYFNYKRLEFDIPINFTNSFRDRVYKELYNVEYGDLVTYKDLASKLNSKAYQAVGSAMANNPYFIIVPCHRVVKSDGTSGQFFYGTKMKEQMIHFERSLVFDKNTLETVTFSDREIEQIKLHPVLSKMFDKMPMVTSYGKFKDPFISILSSIIYQQVAFKVARKSEVKLLWYLEFNVTPNRLLLLTDKQFKSFGISGFRVKYIRNFCEFVINNPEFWSSINTVSEEQLQKTLLSVKGIGSWTIEMFLLFGLGKSDVISYKDLIIINGLKNLYNLEITKHEFNEICSTIKGFESICSLNLWNYMEQKHYLN